MDTDHQARGRSIRADESSGVLHPQNLSRYHARWIEPDPAVREIADQYWHVHWQMDAAEVIDQAIIDLPAVTLSVETGDVPADLVITGLHRHAWHRSITGTGDVFAIRLRPAGLAVLSDRRPVDLADRTIALTAGVDARLHRLMRDVAHHDTPEARAHAADELIAAQQREHALPQAHLLANRILDEIRSRAFHRTGAPLAEHFGVSERTIQRALARTLGIGPKQAANRIRLQEAAKAIALQETVDLAGVAAQLGYTDQAHLTHEFRTATGTTPGAYRRTLRQLAGP